MTYQMLLKLLLEAEARRDNLDHPADVRLRSQETVSLCERRMVLLGITRQDLERLAAAEACDETRMARAC